MVTCFKGATLIDGTGRKPIENASFIVEDEIIKEVRETTETEEDIEVIDCKGKTIVPGLINCHAHVLIEPNAWDSYQTIKDESETSICLRAIENLKLFLKSGVTFVRDLGGYKNIEFELKKAIEDKRIIGPDLLLSGSFLSITGGHCWWIARQCDGEDEFVKGTREQIRAGADLIKVLVTGGYARPKMKVNHNIMPDSPQMTVEEIRAVVEEAHRRGKKVAAHCNGLTGVWRAAQAGVDSIEHGQFNDVNLKLVDEALEMMAEKGIYLVPTLSAFFKNYNKEEVIGKYQSVVDSFTKAMDFGVKIAMGNDSGCPFVGHETAPMEIKHMVEAGMKPMDALMTATKNAADLLGISSAFGTLEPGKYADFIIMEDNPLQNIDAILNIQQVYKGGELVE